MITPEQSLKTETPLRMASFIKLMDKLFSGVENNYRRVPANILIAKHTWNEFFAFAFSLCEV